MIHFLRRIRKRLVTENRVQKYLIYAIGEILLVVIGILIALQINNWNTNKNNEALKKAYIKLIKEDLQKDTVSLQYAIDIMYNDSIQLQKYSRRLSHPKATKDTLIKIARYEFDPWYTSSQIFNNNTYESLISTGKIEIMDAEIVTSLKNLSEMQINYNSGKNISDDVYLDAYRTYSKKYNFKNANNLIQGKLGNELWTNIERNELLKDFNYVLGSKHIVYTNLIISKRKILKETTALITFLNKEIAND